ncbi:DODA-type extradiol aromatic ring-opening family dioxygenase [Elioraea rosea]|uniref:DODA-type extradiol aromatic ring-opening family dioxygenase n=1 Tax=Elioraea rosea TaxID=2492390 RepID=UPI0013156576|nr:class III extradiol ring-cleavage dioxygenase [Elioraea rosea]
MSRPDTVAPLPAFFVSHGAPDFPARPSAARDALSALARTIVRPRAILVATAHWETGGPVLGGAERPITLHDFPGFDHRVRRRRYPAPGDPALAQRAKALLDATGMSAAIDPAHGLDQAVWGPLAVLYPDAEIPVVPLSVQPFADAAHHLAVGRALAPLRREGVLIIGSGAFTHDTRRMTKPGDDTVCPNAARFASWLGEALAAGDTARLLAWEEGPCACTSHSTAEHLFPLFVAYGAAEGEGTLLHASVEQATVAMQIWRFDGSGTERSDERANAATA